MILAVAAVFFAIGVVQKSPCVVTDWSHASPPKSFSHMCYTDIPYLYAGRGLAQGIWPYEPQSDLAAGQQQSGSPEDRAIEYPVLTGVWMGVTGEITHLIGKSPDLSGTPSSDVSGNPGVQYDSAVFWSVNAVGFFVVLLIALLLLVKAQPRRPWDAMLMAAAPMLVLTATINWDVLAIGCVAGIIWAWSTRRPILTGVFIGLGTATKLYPLFFLGPLLVLCLRRKQMEPWVRMCAAALATWLVIDLPVYLWSPEQFLHFWTFNADRGPDLGSLWLVAATYGYTATASFINTTTFIAFGSACVVIGLIGLLAPRRPRVVQLVFLVVAAFLIVNKVYSPQYVLWLLPLAVLARPRWRDLLVWQAAEVYYFFAVWMHLAHFFVAEGNPDPFYAVSIIIRVLGELYLVAMVVRDIFAPWNDPVRADGLSDDPLGGLLDEGSDAEPVEEAGQLTTTRSNAVAV